METRKLNLGCGAFKKSGFLNVDADPRVDPDAVVDLNVLPYPFADGAFDEIHADHVLEHLDDPFAVMAELHRLLAVGGRLLIRVPHFSRGFTHAGHRRGFDVTFPHYFDPRFQGGYSGTPFALERMRLHWFAQPYLKRTVLSPVSFHLARAAGTAIDAAASVSPTLASRLWCFWVGGFEELELRFVKPS